MKKLKSNPFDHAPGRIKIHCHGNCSRKILELLANHLGQISVWREEEMSNII